MQLLQKQNKILVSVPVPSQSATYIPVGHLKLHLATKLVKHIVNLAFLQFYIIKEKPKLW